MMPARGTVSITSTSALIAKFITYIYRHLKQCALIGGKTHTQKGQTLTDEECEEGKPSL